MATPHAWVLGERYMGNACATVAHNDNKIMRKTSGEDGKNMSLDVTPEVAEGVYSHHARSGWSTGAEPNHHDTGSHETAATGPGGESQAI